MNIRIEDARQWQFAVAEYGGDCGSRGSGKKDVSVNSTLYRSIRIPRRGRPESGSGRGHVFKRYRLAWIERGIQLEIGDSDRP